MNKTSNKRKLYCNTPRCGGSITITKEIRPKTTVTASGRHQLTSEAGGICSFCVRASGWVDAGQKSFSNEMNSRFNF